MASRRANDATEFDSKVVTESRRGVDSRGYSSGEGSKEGPNNEPWWMAYDESGPYDSRKSDRNAGYSDSSMEKERMAAGRDMASHKNTSGMRLYSIARGKGGSMAMGLFRDTWD